MLQKVEGEVKRRYPPTFRILSVI